jgi:hypothetical protein
MIPVLGSRDRQFSLQVALPEINNIPKNQPEM